MPDLVDRVPPTCAVVCFFVNCPDELATSEFVHFSLADVLVALYDTVEEFAIDVDGPVNGPADGATSPDGALFFRCFCAFS